MTFRVGQQVWLREAFGPWMKGRITGQVAADQWAVTIGPGMNYLRNGSALRNGPSVPAGDQVAAGTEDQVV